MSLGCSESCLCFLVNNLADKIRMEQVILGNILFGSKESSFFQKHYQFTLKREMVFLRIFGC